MIEKRILFSPGNIYMTPGAAEALREEAQREANSAWSFLVRHLTGDWGDLNNEDKALNNRALRQGERIFSVYKLSTGGKIWIITEADRSMTTFLLPEEY